VHSSIIGIIMLPDFPADSDWGLRLTYAGPVTPEQRRSAAAK
jgi:hypothetical protein